MPNLRWSFVVASGVLVAGLASSPMASVSQQSGDPLSLYGDEIIFEVTRNGDPVGRQTVSFTRDEDDKLNVAIALTLAVKFLGINVYTYDYRSDAVWSGGKLVKLNATQQEDGDITSVTVANVDGEMSVKGPTGIFSVQPGLFPTNHWNAGVVSSTQVINTINGEISNVQIENVGTELIEAQGQTIEATKYVYSGDVDPTVWYDRDGRWVKFRFMAKGNSLIEYRCLKCGLDNRAAATN